LPEEDLWTDGGPNWVGHLITKCSESSDEANPNDRGSSIVVFDYAIGGQTVSGVKNQIERKFIPHVGKQPGWTAEDALFVTWVGINDLAYTSEPSPQLEALFKSEELLYDAGARNFLFIDVPPIDRSPAVLQFRNPSDSSPIPRYNDWNIALRSSLSSFASGHADATILLFSSHATFSRVLDDPVGHDFPEVNAARKAGKGIWMDHLHPTSKMHQWVAKYLAAFLGSVGKVDATGA